MKVNVNPTSEQYSTKELVRRLLALAWRFRVDCLWSLALSFFLLLLGIVGLQLLGVVLPRSCPTGAGLSIRLEPAGELGGTSHCHRPGHCHRGAGLGAGGADVLV